MFGRTPTLSNCYCCLTSPLSQEKVSSKSLRLYHLGGSTEPPLDPPQFEVFLYDHKIRSKVLCWHTIAKGFSFSASVAFLVSTHMELSFSMIIFIILNFFFKIWKLALQALFFFKVS